MLPAWLAPAPQPQPSLLLRGVVCGLYLRSKVQFVPNFCQFRISSCERGLWVSTQRLLVENHLVAAPTRTTAYDLTTLANERQHTHTRAVILQ